MGRIFLIVLIIIGPTLYFIYDTSKDRVISELIEATVNKDQTTLSNRFNWDVVRQNTIDDLKSEKAALGNYGSAIGPPKSKIDEIVNYYIQPQNIELAYYYHEKIFDDLDPNAFIRDISFKAPWGFSITLGYPIEFEGKHHVDPVLKQQLKTRFVFRLDGMTWKIDTLEIPIFMIPHQTYSRPALEQFGDINTDQW